MLNAKKQSRNKVRCFCRDCNRIYVDLRTKNKHSINQNIVKNTSNILQIDNNPMSESSQRSFINEESFIEPQTFVNEESLLSPKHLLTKNLLLSPKHSLMKNLLSSPKHLLTKNLQYFIQK